MTSRATRRAIRGTVEVAKILFAIAVIAFALYISGVLAG